MKKLLIVAALITLAGCSAGGGLAEVREDYNKMVHDPYPYTGRSMMFSSIPVHDLYVEYDETKEKNLHNTYCYKVMEDNYQVEKCFNQ